MKGKAYIIGAGPGDFGLLTIKAKKIIEDADCIIYDRLIPEEILGLNKEAEMIYLGKGNCEGGTIQDEINKTLVEKCLEGKMVARVKGGDPFVFGRGGEEILSLNEHGIPFEVVPGISSSISVPTYAGIPVTHRGLSKSFHVFTGHTQKNGGWHNFEAIAKLDGTLIFLMGVKNLNKIVGDLVSNGKEVNTPIAIIEKGATPNQRVTVGTLDDILEKSEEKKIVPPAIIVIGRNVNLRPEFSWFENYYDESKRDKKRILVTRAKKDAGELVEYINKNGGIGKSLQFLDIEYLSFSLDDLEESKAVLFNSPNGVHAFMKNIKDMRILAGKKIGVVGEKTREVLETYHLTADFMPAEYLGEKLARDAASLTNEGEKILIISSDIAPWSAEKYSRDLKRNFVKIVAYKTKKIHQPKEKIIQELKSVDTVTFLSSSTVKSFYESIGGDLGVVEDVSVGSIGPVTTKTLESLGFKVDYEPKKFTSESMIDCILKF